MLYVSNKETGMFICKVSSIEEGINEINEFEAADKVEGIYVPDFYDVVDETNISVI